MASSHKGKRSSKNRVKDPNKLTRDQQIRAALKLLPPNYDPYCEGFIGFILDTIDRATVAGRVGTKPYKHTVERFRSALTRAENVQSALAELDLAVKADDQSLDLKGWQRFCDQRLGMPPHPHSQARREALAVQWAAVLLRQFRQPLNKSRNRTWAQLAAVLYGDPDLDLFHYLTTYQPPGRPNPGAK
jgi:hypothetical protein